MMKQLYLDAPALCQLYGFDEADVDSVEWVLSNINNYLKSELQCGNRIKLNDVRNRLGCLRTAFGNQWGWLASEHPKDLFTFHWSERGRIKITFHNLVSLV